MRSTILLPASHYYQGLGFSGISRHKKMFFYVKIGSGKSGNLTCQYVCRNCGVRITDSKSLFHVSGKDKHTHVNPMGRVCSFMTVDWCENVIINKFLYLEHSWFVGYGWKFISCHNCYLHLGWRYESVITEIHPGNFYGIMFESVRESSDS
jgi:hypothetical protein